MSSHTILAIETSTNACSAALQVGGDVIERFEIAPRQHTDLILPMVEQVLAASGISLKQLDSIAFAQGPGAFTGLRIAAGVVQGMAMAVDCPVTPVSTLAAMAHGAFREFASSNVLVANDASMGEVYYGAYHIPEFGRAELQGLEHVTALQAIPDVDDREWLALGNGWSSYAEQVPHGINERVVETQSEYFPHAQDVVHLAQGLFESGQIVSADLAIPVYLRDKVVDN